MAEPTRNPRLHHSRRPRLGQNFLVSPSAPRAIADALGDLSDSTVLEIGPGKGVITRLLAARSKHLVAVELDATLAAALKKEFAGEDGPEVEVICDDVLRVDFRKLASAYASSSSNKLVVAGNLPYYITSDILLHLFEHHSAIDRAVLMVQREVADRIVATPGNRDYGVLSATTQMYAHVEGLFTLPPGAFSPPPEVHSTVLRFTMQPRFAELSVDRQRFLTFLRRAFAQKRKTLANNFRVAGYRSALIEAALATCRLDPMVRAEAVSLERMACLFHALEDLNRTS
ncbi:MAG TPA: 16S rRNA (adenine(1518)-N(6)/adenine(1519)-N(6))-dimethyltransferase RsmA [Acidobacteriaceae bacterium]